MKTELRMLVIKDTEFFCFYFLVEIGAEVVGVGRSGGSQTVRAETIERP